MHMKQTFQKIATIFAALLLVGSMSGFAQSDTLRYGNKDKVALAFREAYDGDIVGAYSKVVVDDVEEYDHNVWSNGILTGRTMGMMGANNIRGLGVGIDVSSETQTGASSGNMLYVVDGLPRDITYLRASEIESVTVLKDLNAAVLYGTQAVNGVIMITTKRGIEGKNTSDVNFNFGLYDPIAMPEYMDSWEYMTWYNQARKNDGLEPVYSDEDIQNYKTGNPYRYPSTDYYSDQWLRRFKNYYDLNAEFRGGNKVAKYYVNAGWNSTGSLLDFGRWSSARDNRINIRANVDLQINSWIDMQVDGTAVFRNNKTGRGNYWSEAATRQRNQIAPLLPIDLINPESPELLARKNDVDGKYIFGGSTSITSSVFSNGYGGGTLDGIARKYTFNDRLNFDLKAITPGLSFHTNMNFDFGIFYNQTVYNDVSVYQPTWAADSDTITALKQIGSDNRPGNQTIATPYFQRRMGGSAVLSYDRTFNDVHHVTANAIAFASQYKWRLGNSDNDTETEGTEEQFQGSKLAHLGFQAGYVYDKRYMVDFSATYANSVKLAPGHRRGFSPTFGVAWIASNEDFMQDVSFVDFLKFRLTGGVHKSDIGIPGFFLYDGAWGTSGSWNWDENNRSGSGYIPSRGENYNLGFEVRKEIAFGFESEFLNRTLGLQANAFFNRYSDQVVRTNVLWPGFYTNYTPYENYNEDSYKGFEAGVTYNNHWGDFSLYAGANILYVVSKYEKYSELHDYDYQNYVGHSRAGTWALESLGLFQSQAEIDASPTQTFGTVRPGDIKYKDQNKDGKIDSNDQVYVRTWNPPFSGGIELKLGYKNFTFYTIGYAYWGKDYATFLENENYWWVDAADPYSTRVRDSWTPENPNAKWPALHSVAADNNNRRSTFWMYDNSFFQLRKVQLMYKMPENIARKLYMTDLNLYIDCSNPFQIAPNREYRQLNIGSEPQYRTYSIGFKASF